MDKKKNTVKVSLAFEIENKLKHAEEILIANKELTFQIAEKQKQVDELLIANKKLTFLNTDQLVLFASIVNSSDDAMLSKTLDGIITSWNYGAEKIFGYSADEIIGKNILTLYPPQLQQEEADIIKKIQNYETINQHETWRVRKDGSSFHASLTISPITNFEGNIIGVSKILRDITERKKNELLQQDSNNNYKYLFDNNPFPLLIFDFETLKIIDCNIECLMLYCYSREEFLQLTIKDIRPEEDIEKIIGATKNESTYGEIHKNVWRHLKKNGELMNVEVTGHLLNYNNRRCSLAFINDITERKIAEEKLSKATDTLRNALNDTNKIMDSSLDIICVVDNEGCFVKVSAACEAIWGYKPEELIGKPLINYVYNIDNEKTQITADVVMSGKSIKHFENRYIRKDGSLVPMEWTARWDENDKVRYGVARDMTARKKTVEKIKESEAKLAASQSVAKIGSWETNLINFDVIWSDETCRIFGIDNCLPHTSHENFLKFVHPDDQEKVDNAFAASFTSDLLNSIEHRIIAADGIVKEVEERWHIATDENGKPILALGTVQDITERKKAEEQLVHEKYRLSLILEGTNAGTWEWNIERGETIFNERWAEIIGYTLEELSPVSIDTWIRFTHPDDLKLSGELLEKHFKGALDYYEYEARMKHKEGHWVWVLDRGKVHKWNEVGEPLLMSGTHQDITERKLAEAQIIKTTEQLRQLTNHLQTIREDERKRIAREIHDELGQQLTAIKMDTVWIDKQIPAETVAVKNKLQNMLELLDGSHQSVRKILNELRPAALDDDGLLEALQWQGRQFTESTGIPVHFKTNLESSNLTNENTTCIFRAYQESLTNIMRYANASVVVSSVNSSNESIIFTVEDDGKGFDTALSETKKRFGLLGMKERVISLNGKFDLISSPGKGTKIVIHLPYKNI